MMDRTAPAPLSIRPWWPSAAALAVATVALGVALLVPRLFSDPVGADPWVLRLTGVALGLAATSLVWRRLAAARAVLLAMLAMTAAFSLFSAGPQLIADVSDGALSFNARLLAGSAAEAALTVALVMLAVRLLPADQRPLMRLRRFDHRVAGVTAVGILLFLGVVMVLPARWLGREGLAPIALARDLPLFAPACALQAASQELQFRGLLMGALDQVAPPWASNLAQAGLFGVAHVAIQYQGPAGPFVPVTVALGLVLGVVTQRSRSLWPAILIHAVADIAVTVAVIAGLYGY